MNYRDLTVVIPTLNEAQTIDVLLGKLTKSYANINVLVADDGSTDRTKETVRRFGNRNRRIRLLDRTKAKEHGPTISDMDAAMHVGTPYMIIMDGDLQHPYEKVAQMHELLKKNDVVVAVRTKIKKWKFHRLMLSRAATYISYIVFTIRRKPRVSDMMSGFELMIASCRL